MSFKSCVILCKKYFIVPVTSLLTICLVSYISYTFLFRFAPQISSPTSFLMVVGFIPWPVLIFAVLFQIILGDPGHVTQKMVHEIYAQNNIDPKEIGRSYLIADVLQILTENYLKQQGIIEEANIDATMNEENEAQPLN